jgi:purine-binding chemotaxis protein CheW
MRLTPIDNAPSFVAGLSVIRGMAYPVLDLRKFFQGDGVDAPKRLIAIRVAGARRVALLVDAVLGQLPARSLGFQALPPILKSAQTEVIEALAMLDGQLLQVLDGGKLVPDSVWKDAVTGAGAS